MDIEEIKQVREEVKNLSIKYPEWYFLGLERNKTVQETLDAIW